MSSNTRIGTANKGKTLDATHAGRIDLQTKRGQFLPGFEKVLFIPKLRENLTSVGKICDGGCTIVFNACGSKIFQNKGLKIDGKEIHYEKRDKHTGMYPLTLYPPDRFALSASTKFLDEEGSLDDLVLIARAVLEKTRTVDGSRRCLRWSFLGRLLPRNLLRLVECTSARIWMRHLGGMLGLAI